MPSRSIAALCALGLLVLLAAGCAPLEPAVTPQISPQISVDATSDARVTAEPRGQTLLVDIRSETGIGSASVTLPDEAAWREIILRLHLSGLEQLRFDYPAATVQLHLPSTDLPAGVLPVQRLPLQQEATPAGAAQPVSIGQESDQWMDVLALAAEGATPSIPLVGGYFDVRVPRAFLREGHRTFTVSWIDFFR